MAHKKVTWKKIRRLIQGDRQQLRRYLEYIPGHEPLWLSLHPSFWAVALHRVAFYWYHNGYGKIARVTTQVNLFFTGFDIHPASDIDEGMLVIHPTATTCSGKAGKNFTLMPLSGIGFIPSDVDIGAGPGLPWLGDNVTVGSMGGVLGPWRIGSNVVIQPSAACFRHVDDWSMVLPLVSPTNSEINHHETLQALPGFQNANKCDHRRLATGLRDFGEDADRYVAELVKACGGRPSLMKKLSALTTTQLFVTGTYRFSHFLHENGFERTALFIAWLNRIFNKTSISPVSCIKGGFFLPHPVGAVVHVCAGRQLTMYARTLCVGQASGAFSDLSQYPSVGKGIVLAGHAAILGSVKVGDQVKLGSHVNLTQSIDSDRVVVSAGVLTKVEKRESSAATDEKLIDNSKRKKLSISWRLEKKRLERDWQRLLAMNTASGRKRNVSLFFSPAWLCVLFHRLSHYYNEKGKTLLARIFWQLNVMVTGADINPASDLDGGLLIPFPAGVSIHAKAKENLTVLALCSINGWGGNVSDIFENRDWPAIGNNVYLSHHSGIFGPVTIGDNVRLDSGSFIMEDTEENTLLKAPRVRVQRL